MNRLFVGIAAILAICIMLIGSGAANAQSFDLGGLPPNLQEKIEDLLSTRWPPLVKSVKLEPAAPVAGEETAITVKTPLPSKESSDYTTAASVVYSTDGGKTWEEVELEEGSDDTEWVGTLPGFDSGTEVIYGIRALDSSNNVYVELPCSPEVWPPADEYIDESCMSKDDYEACVTNLPHYCMFPMAKDDDGNDDDSVVPADLDFWDYRVGHSGDNVYLDLAVEGKIYEGTISPMDIYLYAIVVKNPDKGEAATIKDLLEKGIAIAYIPNIKIGGGAIPAGASECTIAWQQGGEAAFDSKSVNCKKKKQHLFIDFKKEMAFDNPSEYLSFIVLDGHLTDLSVDAAHVGNFSRFTNAKMISRSFKVE